LPLAVALIGLLVTVPFGEHTVAPFPNGVLNANVNVGLAGVLAWFWAAGDRRRWIPYAAGVGAAFKIFPGALALWGVRRRGWRALFVAVGMAASVAAASAVVTLPIVGLDEWTRFVTALANAEPTCAGGRASVACLSQPYVGTGTATLVGIVVGVALLGVSLLVRSEFPAFVLLTAGMLAPLADGHHHYLLFVYVLIVIGLCRLVATWAGSEHRGRMTLRRLTAR
jgi:hypothetical protein